MFFNIEEFWTISKVSFEEISDYLNSYEKAIAKDMVGIKSRHRIVNFYD